MTMASSTSPPGFAGPSATSSGWMALMRSCAAAGAARNSSRKRNRSTKRRLCEASGLVEVGPQPARRRLDVDPSPFGIIGELVLADLSDSEILAVAVAEVEAGDRRGRQHGEVVGERDSGRIVAEQRKQQWFQRMVRA